MYNDEHRKLTFFEEMFHIYYKPLYAYAYRYVNDKQAAEDIVQDVFLALWIKKNEVNFDEPIKSYLYKATYNKAINYLTSVAVQRVDKGTIDGLLNMEILSCNQYDTLLLKEITHEINVVVETLPPQCKKVFRLSRGANMKNKEIASLLGISEKAVEKHITKALTEIRNYLIRMDLMPVLLCMLLN